MSKHEDDKQKVIEQKAQDKLSLTANRPEDANLEFIDYVQATWNPEIVILSLIQRNQEGIPALGANGLLLEGRLVVQAALTWPHVVRLRDLLNKAIEENRVAAIATLNDAFKEGDQNVQ